MAVTRGLDPRCSGLELPEEMSASMVRLGNGNLLAVKDNAAFISEDDGKSWSETGPVYTGKRPGLPDSGLLLQTRDDWTILVYLDLSTYIWSWDDEMGQADPNARLDVWSVRSPDGGETWMDRQRIMEGYCGALITMIQMVRGNIVVPVQILLRDPDRYATMSYMSEDDGKTWTHSNILDLGGHGHHDGAMEATLAELGNGSLLMLIRTNLDYFWESYSMDQGRSWRILQKSEIDASSSPGYLLRLASGRLCLVWNRLNPQDGSAPVRRSGHYSRAEASWQREELALAFSDDEARSWSDPQVVATRSEPPFPCYPVAFEHSPGLLWITAGDMKFSLREEDFVAESSIP